MGLKYNMGGQGGIHLITKKRVDGVPMIEYRGDSYEKVKGVIFIVHGHTGQKELGDLEKYPIHLMESGYLVLVIDAFKHGERIEEPYISQTGLDKTLAMPEVIFHTAMDIIQLYESYYQLESDNLIVSGISMGGHIAFQIPKYYPKVKTILPFIGSPDIPSHYFITKKAIIQDSMYLCKAEVEALQINDLTPYLNCNIAMMNGEQDDVVEARFAKSFYEKLTPFHQANLFYKEYPCGHRVTDEMLEDVYAFLDRI